MNDFQCEDDIYIGMEAAVEKLTHYYDNMSPMVGIALALDPSKKFKYLEKGLNWEVEWVNSIFLLPTKAVSKEGDSYSNPFKTKALRTRCELGGRIDEYCWW